MSEFTDELRSRINPAYAHQIGTESYERRVCAEHIERLENEAVAATLRIENDSKYLSNLLARVHRDGGHYEAEHGRDMAAAHADMKAAVAYANLDEAWDKIIATEKERDALKLDAARWRFAKTMSRAISADIDGWHYWNIQLTGCVRGPTLDAAVDAAMREIK